MNEKTGGKGTNKPEKTRDDRLKQALRENLKRRKAQARSRAARAEKKD